MILAGGGGVTVQTDVKTAGKEHLSLLHRSCTAAAAEEGECAAQTKGHAGAARLRRA